MCLSLHTVLAVIISHPSPLTSIVLPSIKTRSNKPTVVLRDLISGRLVLVEVVLAVKVTHALYLAAKRNGSSQGRYQRCCLEGLPFVKSDMTFIKKQNKLVLTG